MQLKPFTIAIGDEQLDDLERRLAHIRWPDAVDGMHWENGTDETYLRRLTDYWRTQFDWRAQEARLNRLPQFTASLDGLDIHLIHQRGTGPDPFPLVLGHGWPGTGFDMHEVIPLLTDPGAHGADPADAFDVVVPSLPGYGFSQRPEQTGYHAERVAGMWRELMGQLGYERFGLHGEDWGALVSTWLAFRDPDPVAGLHMTFTAGSFRPPLGEGERPLSAAEQAFLDQRTAWFDAEGAYHRLHSTKPQTPSYALTDSPAGLAAWIVEKNRSWSDCDGDVERVFSLDQLLTNISIYWFTATIGSSMRFYWEDRRHPNHFGPGDRVLPPTALALPPKEINPPREFAERVYNITRWTDLPAGNHFSAIETPEPLVEDIRAFFRPLRDR